MDFGVPVRQAVKSATINPAKAIGAENEVGSIEDGKSADFTVLNPDFSIRMVIARGSDGHFRVAGSINGQPVVFMVDTGASVIAVTDALAQRAGLEGGEVTQFRTANGLRPGRVVVAQSVAVGPLRVSGLRVGTGYTGEVAGDALLGQNFLQHFDVQMQRDRMVLRPHP